MDSTQASEQRFLDDDGRLVQWPTKHKDKLLVLAYLSTKFSLGASYTEQEVNDLLKQWHTFGDWPLLRRELFDRGFFDRNLDGTDYRLKQLSTELSDLILVRPNIINDGKIAVGWLAGPSGRDTLRLMGNTDQQNKPSTLDEENQRVRDFVTATDKVFWSMRYKDETVGVVWLDLDASEYLSAPSVHLMIGNPVTRGKGVGTAAVKTIIAVLKLQDNNEFLYSRYLMENAGSKRLLNACGFINDGAAYADKDGLNWQNVKLSLRAK